MGFQEKSTGNLLRNKRFIRIRNCQNLTVPHGSFKSGPLTVVFQDIKNLTLATGCFEASKNDRINVTILNSTASEFPSGMFRVTEPEGRLPQDSAQPSSSKAATPTLVFTVADSEIKKVASGVFANFTLREMYIINTIIGRIDTEAINNQVQKTITFNNNTFGSLSQRAVVLHSSPRDTELVFERNNFTSKDAMNSKTLQTENISMQVCKTEPIIFPQTMHI